MSGSPIDIGKTSMVLTTIALLSVLVWWREAVRNRRCILGSQRSSEGAQVGVASVGHSCRKICANYDSQFIKRANIGVIGAGPLGRTIEAGPPSALAPRAAGA